MIAVFGYGILFFFFGSWFGFYLGMLFFEWKIRREMKKQGIQLDVKWTSGSLKEHIFEELDKSDIE